VSKILLVDDEKTILLTVGMILEKEGYEVIEADSGKRCLEILKNEKPDLILMDVMMTEMDGWEAVKEIKKDRSNDGIVISMLTVKSQEGDKVKSLSEADWHISKPVRRDKLVHIVNWLLTNPSEIS
jgi:two-component system alkaline phosphatase synthesis response regulator PhoP